MLYTILILVSLIVILCLIYVKKEHFIDVLFTQDTQRQSVIINKGDYDERLFSFIRKMDKKFFITEDAYPTADDIVYDDIIGYMRNMTQNTTLLAVTGEQKNICFIKDVMQIDSGHIKEVVNSKIGYLHNKDVDIIKSILFCYDVKVKDIDLVKFENYEQGIMALNKTKEIKALFIFANHNDPSFIDQFKDLKLSLYSFEDIDLQKIRYILPYATIKNYDFKLSFPNYIDKFTVKTTLLFDNVLYIHSNNWHFLMDYIILYFEDNFHYINLYAQSFKIHPRTRSLLAHKDRLVITKQYRPVLEQFSTNNKPLTFNIEKNIPGFYESHRKLFILYDIFINGIPLNIDDIIILIKQNRNIENGEYIVRHIDTIKKQALLQQISSPIAEKTGIEDKSDPRYICATDKNIKIKSLCESKYDIDGEPKKSNKPDVWDRPCDVDTECPYFQKNTTYKNYRGGCINGFCEMPLGVTRLGFRKQEGKPFCYGCPDKFDPNCCEKQKQPDYIFLLDDYERQPEVIETFADNFIEGDYYKVSNKNVYHYELTNKEIFSVLKALINTTYKPRQTPVDIKTMLYDTINSLVETPFNIYDLVVETKELSKDNKSAFYIIFATIYREGKSHGKRLLIKFEQNIDNGGIIIKDIIVKGVVPSENIKELIKENAPLGQQENIYATYIHNFSQPEFKQIKPTNLTEESDIQDYMCKRAKKLELEHNIKANC